MANFSFDVVSEVDLQEVDNAVNQAKKEVAQRYDFKNSISAIDFNKTDKKIALSAEDDYKLNALKEILVSKLIKRGVSGKSLTFGDQEKILGGHLKQTAEIITGIEKEKARDLVKEIKALNLKVQVAIEGEKLRVSGAKKDDLQAVITHLRGLDYPIPLMFCNYR